MTISFSDKVGIVTGAGQGIGRATAIVFGELGAQIVVADTDRKKGEETVEIMKWMKIDASFISCDVSDGNDVENMVDHAVQRYGRLDYAVNNAGVVGSLHDTIDYSEENWNHVIGVNLTGVFLCLKAEIRRMLEFGGGAIVNVSSALGQLGDRGRIGYVASKHGVNGLTRAASLEYAHQGIRVNAVGPGPMRTEMIEGQILANPGLEEVLVSRAPIGRMGDPREVGVVAAWLCSDSASYIAGHTLAVDGGQVIESGLRPY